MYRFSASVRKAASVASQLASAPVKSMADGSAGWRNGRLGRRRRVVGCGSSYEQGLMVRLLEQAVTRPVERPQNPLLGEIDHIETTGSRRLAILVPSPRARSSRPAILAQPVASRRASDRWRVSRSRRPASSWRGALCAGFCFDCCVEHDDVIGFGMGSIDPPKLYRRFGLHLTSTEEEFRARHGGW